MKTNFLAALGLVTILSLTLITTANAALPANMSWVKYTSNPVAPSGLCGVTDLSKPFVLVETPGSNYKMYFTSMHTGAGAQIYLATSTNGTSWTCATGNSPVIPLGGSGMWDAIRVTSPTVVKEDATHYKMWYSGRDANANWGIGYATSSDGVTWAKYGILPVMTQGSPSAWDASIREPSVVRVDSTHYHMWYAGFNTFPYFKIGHATSPDGIVWTKDAGNPVLSGTPGTWDANEVYAPYVVQNGGAYEMFYSGQNGNRWLTGHATASSPGGSWTKDTNAILSPSGIGWESGDSLDMAAAVLDGSTWKVFYSQGGAYQIGLATLQSSAQLTFNPLVSTLAVGADEVVTIDLTSVANLYGYQFEVLYDAAKVSATGAFVDSFFDTTTNANIPPLWNHACAAGVCKFAAAKVLPGVAVSGSGTLAQITFHGVAAGNTKLTFANVLLGTKDGVTISTTDNTGFITVYGTATISGSVLLQGRILPHDTFSVTLYDNNGIVAPTSATVNTADGTWSATVPAYGLMSYTAAASHSLYLRNNKNPVSVGVGGSAAIVSTKLLGGDANNDGTISIHDLSCVGGDFALPPGTCSGTGSSDINADGNVNILDLVLVGGNYGLNTPQPW